MGKITVAEAAKRTRRSQRSVLYQLDRLGIHKETVGKTILFDETALTLFPEKSAAGKPATGQTSTKTKHTIVLSFEAERIAAAAATRENIPISTYLSQFLENALGPKSGSKARKSHKPESSNSKA